MNGLVHHTFLECPLVVLGLAHNRGHHLMTLLCFLKQSYRHQAVLGPRWFNTLLFWVSFQGTACHLCVVKFVHGVLALVSSGFNIKNLPKIYHLDYF